MRLVLMVSQGKKISRSNYNPLLGPGPRDNFWDAVGSVYGRSVFKVPLSVVPRPRRGALPSTKETDLG